MRYGSALLVATFAVAGCSSDKNSDNPGNSPDSGNEQPDSGSGGSGGNDGQVGDSDSGGGGESGDGGIGLLAACSADEIGVSDAGADPDAGATADAGSTAPPRRLVSGAAVPVGVTAGNQLVYRDNNKLSVVDLREGSTPVDISTVNGTPLIKGRTVFFWSAIDYDAGRADLSIWTTGKCVRQVKRTLSADDSVSASGDGAYVMYPVNVSDKAFDLVVANRDFTSQQVLIRRIGRASDDTCRAKYGFAGARVVVASCDQGSRDAKLAVYSVSGGTWTATSIASAASGTWSAAADGSRVFYTSSKSEGLYWDVSSGQSISIDDGVGWALLAPNASALLYVVEDQLRRTALPNAVPIPIVTNHFRYLDSVSPDLNYALYSTTVVYEGGEKRDLSLTRTTSFNPTPTKLVATPLARLSRSAFSADSKSALYLTEVDANGAGMMHVQGVAGGIERTIEKVDTIVAARGSQVVFSSKRSSPDVYPIVAELDVLDAASDEAPTVLRTTIIDGRSFYVTADGSSVVYARPRDGQNASTDGIWLHPLP